MPTDLIKKWIGKHSENLLVRNTGYMIVGQGLTVLIQAAYFVIMTRSLGAKEYGTFIAAMAFAQIVAPFVGFGGSNLLIKNVSRDRSQFGVYWGNLLLTTVLTGLTAAGMVIAVSRFLLPNSVPVLVILCITIAELLFARLVDSAAMAFQAVERFDVVAKITVWGAMFRLLGMVGMAILVREPLATQWALIYLLTTILGAALSLSWVQLRIGRPRLALGIIKNEFVEGLSFAISLSAQSVYNDIDKTMLASMSTLDAVGIYAAAYRIVDVVFLPVRSLLNAAYPGFFRAGAEGLQSAVTYLRRFLPNATKYSLLAFLCMNVGAPLVQTIFGPDFARTVEALRWLAVLPLLKSTHYFLADTLTCAGHQRLRSSIQVIVAFVNIMINLWLIPAYSWRGAAWSSVACDGLLALSMYVALRILRAGPTGQLAADSGMI